MTTPLPAPSGQVLLITATSLNRDGSGVPSAPINGSFPGSRGSPSEILRPDLTKRQAEDWLDWLEAHGQTQAQVARWGNQRFAVHWNPASTKPY
jgi:hypothetical protein